MWVGNVGTLGALLSAWLVLDLVQSGSSGVAARPASRAMGAFPERGVVRPLPLPEASRGAGAATKHVALEVSHVRMVVANIREGSVIRPRVDMADGDDRGSFARRLFDKAGHAPDIVLLQETLGRARTVVAHLNEHPRAVRAGARYVVVVPPRIARELGPCAGARSGPYTTLRDSAIVANAQTVMSLGEQGAVRTWGRWGPEVRERIGRLGYGCAEQPWIRVSVQHSGDAPRTALVASAHIAPSGAISLKSRAVTLTRRDLEARHAANPGDLVVLGGYLNLARCSQPATEPERRGCAVRAAHQGLLDADYQDAVRARHLTGPTGVVGVSRRIDFLYVKGAVEASWFDRCYQAYFVKFNRCQAHRVIFGQRQLFAACDRRSRFYGSPGGACSARHYRNYYSDHPILLATVR